MEVVFYIDREQAYFPPVSVKLEWKSQKPKIDYNTAVLHDMNHRRNS